MDHPHLTAQPSQPKPRQLKVASRLLGLIHTPTWFEEQPKESISTDKTKKYELNSANV